MKKRFLANPDRAGIRPALFISRKNKSQNSIPNQKKKKKKKKSANLKRATGFIPTPIQQPQAARSFEATGERRLADMPTIKKGNFAIWGKVFLH